MKLKKTSYSGATIMNISPYVNARGKTKRRKTKIKKKS